MKQYDSVKIELIVFSQQDVVTSSLPNDSVTEDIFG